MSGKEPSERPAFSAPLYAAVRQGSKELGQALKAFPDSVHPVEEPGTLGNPTQAQLTDAMKSEGFDDRFDAYANRPVEEEPPQRGMSR